MPIFKYTVANKEGKKLSGTVEAPSEEIARKELNNLGFSILLLQQIEKLPDEIANQPKFIFEAVDKNNKIVSGTIPAISEEEAYKKLQEEYDFTVTATWKEGSTIEEVEAARKRGGEKLQQKVLTDQADDPKFQNLEEEKKAVEIKAKTESILTQVNELLKTYEANFSPTQKSEINKKIDKLLRIKNSSNSDYVLASAQDLLMSLEEAEKQLLETGMHSKELELKLKTKKLLNELNSTSRPKTLGEDILEKISKWEKHQAGKTTEAQNLPTKLVGKVLAKIKSFFETAPEVVAIKEQIKVYNKQIFEFAKMYLKKGTPEYKQKLRKAIGTIWEARKRAVANLVALKEALKNQKANSQETQLEDGLLATALSEINALSGWLLAFYVLYYFAGIYLNTKDFNLAQIPSEFQIYNTHVFKYILGITFLLHACTAIKINFFKKSLVADAVLPPIFIFGSIIIILNF